MEAPKLGEVKRIAAQMGIEVQNGRKLLAFAELFYLRGVASADERAVRDAFIIEEYAKGKTQKEIGAALTPPLSGQRVNQIVLANGMNRRNGGKHKQALDRWQAEGKTR